MVTTLGVPSQKWVGWVGGRWVLRQSRKLHPLLDVLIILQADNLDKLIAITCGIKSDQIFSFILFIDCSLNNTPILMKFPAWCSYKLVLKKKRVSRLLDREKHGSYIKQSVCSRIIYKYFFSFYHASWPRLKKFTQFHHPNKYPSILPILQ